MELKWVQQGLGAATKAGERPPRQPRTTRNREWMVDRWAGTGITMIDTYRGLVTGIKFKCEKGHVFEESAGLVANQKTRPCCVEWHRRSLRTSLR